MKFPIGSQLPNDFADFPMNEPDVVKRNRAVYRVTHVLRETPWSCLYRGKKVFRNFEFAKGTLTEAADNECLDVLIRTLSYPQTDDGEYVKSRREHSRFEAQQVLGFRHTNLTAEPLDYFEIQNDQDKFTFPCPGNIPQSEPVLVFATIHGDDLEHWQKLRLEIGTVSSTSGDDLNVDFQRDYPFKRLRIKSWHVRRPGVPIQISAAMQARITANVTAPLLDVYGNVIGQLKDGLNVVVQSVGGK